MNTSTVEILKSKGISPSVQRVAVFEYLQLHHTHPTAEDIFRDLHPAFPTLSRTTVYNTLTLLAAHELVDSFSTDGNVTHYDGQTHCHAHFQCDKCNKIFDFPTPELAPLTAEGFSVKSIKLFYFGTCHNCARD